MEEGDLVREYKAMHEETILLQLAEGGCGRHIRKEEQRGRGQREGKQEW